jgi:purine-binding chemotaxis protein CheW
MQQQPSHGLEHSQYLTFVIAGEEYAVGILQVKEIIQYDTVTRVPKTPCWIRGVINLRGGVVPVVDLAVKFGLPETPISGSTCIVITEVELGGEQTVMGVLADAVSQVIDLRPDDIEVPPSFGTSIHVDYLLGMGKVGKKFVLMLDIDKVLSSEELLATSGAAEAAEGGAQEPHPDADRGGPETTSAEAAAP